MIEEENQQKPLPVEEEKDYKKKRITRSNEDKIIFGLCGGLGRGTLVSVQTYRIIFLIATFLGGWGIIAYLIASALVPRDKGESQLSVQEEQRLRVVNRKLLFGYLLISFGIFFIFDFVNLFYVFRIFGIPQNIILPLVVLAIGIFFTINSYRFAGTVYFNSSQMSRSGSDHKIAGVCGGIAEYLNVDSLPIRVLTLLFLFATMGLGILIYLLFIVLIPKNGEASEQE
jgi:phage shock protein PspC (stress-responsive transcriptional regulator)